LRRKNEPVEEREVRQKPSQGGNGEHEKHYSDSEIQQRPHQNIQREIKGLAWIEIDHREKQSACHQCCPEQCQQRHSRKKEELGKHKEHSENKHRDNLKTGQPRNIVPGKKQ
jgi:hypothetical protein